MLPDSILNSGMKFDPKSLQEMSRFLKDADPLKNKNLATGNIDIGDLFQDEMSALSGVDFNLWTETIDLQKKFNDSVAPNWEKDPRYDFWMAILDEFVEVLGSKHWKWWKDAKNFNKVNWFNVQVEMIDLFHFILSLALRQNTQDLIFVTLYSLEQEYYVNAKQRGEDYNHKITPGNDFFEDFWEQMMLAIYIKSLPLISTRWVEFWLRLGKTTEDLFKAYRIKAALNKLRQKYGYGTGHYKKLWPALNEPGKLYEDNKVAEDLVKDIPLDQNFLNTIESILDEYYRTKILKDYHGS